MHQQLIRRICDGSRWEISDLDVSAACVSIVFDEKTEERFAGLTFSVYNAADAAAVAAISEQHDRYAMVNLCNYLERCFPQEPPV